MSKVALIIMVAVGFFVIRWLRKSYPSSVHAIVKGTAFWAVLALGYLAREIDATRTIPIDFILVGLLTVLGFVLGYAIDLAPANGSNNPAPAKSAEEKTEVMHNNLANIIKGAKLEHFPTAAWRSPSASTITSQPCKRNDATTSDKRSSNCYSLPSQESLDVGKTGLSWSRWRGQ